MINFFSFLFSVFANFFDTDPTDGTILGVKELASEDWVVKITKEIRRLLSIYQDTTKKMGERLQAKTKAKSLKQQLPAATPAAFFEGGKARANLKHFLDFLCFDIDHITMERVEELMTAIRDCPHAVMAQPSSSGCGIHIALLIDAAEWLNSLWDGKDVKPFLFVYDQVCDYIENFLSEKTDSKCRKAEQIFGICGDDRFYLNEHALPFHVDVQKYEADKKQLSTTCKNTQTGKYSSSLEAVKKHIIDNLSKAGCKFVESNRNHYIHRFAAMCNDFGVQKDEVEQYLVNGFVDEDFNENEILSTIKSAYKNTDVHGTKTLQATNVNQEVLSEEYIAQAIEKYQEYKEGYLLDVTKEIPEKEHLFKIGETPFIALGEISAIKGKQKQGKTNVIAEVVAVNIAGRWGKIERIHESSFKCLYFDTEQHPADTSLICQRACTMAEVEFTNHYEWLMPYTLRDVFDIDKLKEIVVSQVAVEKPKLIFIDGIVDLIENFNDVVESKQVIDWLCALASKFDSALVCALHENKNAEDKNMRGHLGTRLSQKATTTLQCVKDKKTGIFTVSSDDERRKPLEGWSFRFENDNIVCADELKAQLDMQLQQNKAEMKAQKKQEEQDEHLRIITEILHSRPGQFMALTSLKKAYMEKTGIKALNTCKTHIMALVDAGKLFKSSDDIISLSPMPGAF